MSPAPAAPAALAPVALVRRPDWRPRLNAYLEAARLRPFAYGGRGGRQDCALFVAGGIAAMTGVDLARGWRGWRTRAEGLARLRAAGVADHVALAARLLPEIPPLLAGPGDVVVAEAAALGLCQGRLAYVPGPEGLALVPMEGIVRGFRV